MKIEEFYLKTSPYTDLGLYKDFVKNLPDDIEELCLLQRMNIIHPVAFKDKDIRTKKDCFWGDMTKVPITKSRYENDIFPTAQAIFAELLRRNPNYSIEREAKDKVHVTCREQSILLASTLKAKGIPARARAGFAEYIHYDGVAYDHWITEYLDDKENRWKLVDADMHCPPHEIKFDLNDIPYSEFLFGAEAYVGLRENKIKSENVCHTSEPPSFGLKAAIKALFFDFHSLMNDEIVFLHSPKYIKDKNFKLSEEEYRELDKLAKLMLDPNENFEKLYEVWNSNDKFRIMSGGLN